MRSVHGLPHRVCREMKGDSHSRARKPARIIQDLKVMEIPFQRPELATTQKVTRFTELKPETPGKTQRTLPVHSELIILYHLS